MKTYKGYELIKAIAEGDIEDGTRFKDSSGNVYIKTNDVGYLEDERGDAILDCFYSLDELALTTFELIEDNTIDIDSIEEFIIDLDFNDLDKFEDGMQIEDKINQLIQAVKQLNKEIKELKEK